MKNLNPKNLAVLVLVFALLLMTTACGAGQTVVGRLVRYAACTDCGRCLRAGGGAAVPSASASATM